MKKISFVIPCYQSEKTIEGVVSEIKNTISQTEKNKYEIIMVNDGSPDGVWDVISRLSDMDEHCKGISLFRNFGQINAQMAGLNYATGDVVVFLDDDGQCPIDKLSELISPLDKGYDVSVAKYSKKKQGLFKNLGSHVNYRMSHWILDLPSGFVMSNFFAITDKVAKEICNYKNPYPYFTGLLFRVTRNIASVEMKDRERVFGRSGYNLKKLVSLWLNGFTNFSVKPLRIASFVGALAAVGGFVWGAIIVIQKLLRYDVLAGYSSIVACILFIGGLLMLMMGIVGEYVGRIFICINQSPQYVVRETKNLTEGRSEVAKSK